jgi:hypothetical protein
MKFMYNFLDRRDKEERLTFNVLVGRHLRDITLCLGVIQVVYALLSFVDRLNPTVDSTVYYVEILANASFWAGAFLVSGIFVIVSMKFMELRAIGMAVSAACLFIWGTIIFFKALTAERPVALSLGLTVAALGVVAYKACLSWNVLMFNQKFGHEDVKRVEEVIT